MATRLLKDSITDATIAVAAGQDLSPLVDGQLYPARILGCATARGAVADYAKRVALASTDVYPWRRSIAVLPQPITVAYCTLMRYFLGLEAAALHPGGDAAATEAALLELVAQLRPDELDVPMDMARWTPLAVAVASRRASPTVLQALVLRGARPVPFGFSRNPSNSTGVTTSPLHMVCAQGRLADLPALLAGLALEVAAGLLFLLPGSNFRGMAALWNRTIRPCYVPPAELAIHAGQCAMVRLLVDQYLLPLWQPDRNTQAPSQQLLAMACIGTDLATLLDAAALQTRQPQVRLAYADVAGRLRGAIACTPLRGGTVCTPLQAEVDDFLRPGGTTRLDTARDAFGRTPAHCLANHRTNNTHSANSAPPLQQQSGGGGMHPPPFGGVGLPPMAMPSLLGLPVPAAAPSGYPGLAMPPCIPGDIQPLGWMGTDCPPPLGGVVSMQTAAPQPAMATDPPPLGGFLAPLGGFQPMPAADGAPPAGTPLSMLADLVTTYPTLLFVAVCPSRMAKKAKNAVQRLKTTKRLGERHGPPRAAPDVPLAFALRCGNTAAATLLLQRMQAACAPHGRIGDKLSLPAICAILACIPGVMGSNGQRQRHPAAPEVALLRTLVPQMVAWLCEVAPAELWHAVPSANVSSSSSPPSPRLPLLLEVSQAIAAVLVGCAVHADSALFRLVMSALCASIPQPHPPLLLTVLAEARNASGTTPLAAAVVAGHTVFAKQLVTAVQEGGFGVRVTEPLPLEAPSAGVTSTIKTARCRGFGFHRQPTALPFYVHLAARVLGDPATSPETSGFVCSYILTPALRIPVTVSFDTQLLVTHISLTLAVAVLTRLALPLAQLPPQLQQWYLSIEAACLTADGTARPVLSGTVQATVCDDEAAVASGTDASTIEVSDPATVDSGISGRQVRDIVRRVRGVKPHQLTLLMALLRPCARVPDRQELDAAFAWVLAPTTMAYPPVLQAAVAHAPAPMLRSAALVAFYASANGVGATDEGAARPTASFNDNCNTRTTSYIVLQRFLRLHERLEAAAAATSKSPALDKEALPLTQLAASLAAALPLPAAGWWVAAIAALVDRLLKREVALHHSQQRAAAEARVASCLALLPVAACADLIAASNAFGYPAANGRSVAVLLGAIAQLPHAAALLATKAALLGAVVLAALAFRQDLLPDLLLRLCPPATRWADVWAATPVAAMDKVVTPVLFAPHRIVALADVVHVSPPLAESLVDRFPAHRWMLLCATTLGQSPADAPSARLTAALHGPEGPEALARCIALLQLPSGDSWQTPGYKQRFAKARAALGRYAAIAQQAFTQDQWLALFDPATTCPRTGIPLHRIAFAAAAHPALPVPRSFSLPYALQWLPRHTPRARVRGGLAGTAVPAVDTVVEALCLGNADALIRFATATEPLSVAEADFIRRWRRRMPGLALGFSARLRPVDVVELLLKAAMRTMPPSVFQHDPYRGTHLADFGDGCWRRREGEEEEEAESTTLAFLLPLALAHQGYLHAQFFNLLRADMPASGSGSIGGTAAAPVPELTDRALDVLLVAQLEVPYFHTQLRCLLCYPLAVEPTTVTTDAGTQWRNPASWPPASPVASASVSLLKRLRARFLHMIPGSHLAKRSSLQALLTGMCEARQVYPAGGVRSALMLLREAAQVAPWVGPHIAEHLPALATDSLAVGDLAAFLMARALHAHFTGSTDDEPFAFMWPSEQLPLYLQRVEPPLTITPMENRDDSETEPFGMFRSGRSEVLAIGKIKDRLSEAQRLCLYQQQQQQQHGAVAAWQAAPAGLPGHLSMAQLAEQHIHAQLSDGPILGYVDRRDIASFVRTGAATVTLGDGFAQLLSTRPDALRRIASLEVPAVLRDTMVTACAIRTAARRARGGSSVDDDDATLGIVLDKELEPELRLALKTLLRSRIHIKVDACAPQLAASRTAWRSEVAVGASGDRVLLLSVLVAWGDAAEGQEGAPLPPPTAEQCLLVTLQQALDRIYSPFQGSTAHPDGGRIPPWIALYHIGLEPRPDADADAALQEALHRVTRRLGPCRRSLALADAMQTWRRICWVPRVRAAALGASGALLHFLRTQLCQSLLHNKRNSSLLLRNTVYRPIADVIQHLLQEGGPAVPQSVLEYLFLMNDLAAAPPEAECVVCYTPLVTPVLLQCRHIVCYECLLHMQRSRVDRCPQCRAVTIALPKTSLIVGSPQAQRKPHPKLVQLEAIVRAALAQQPEQRVAIVVPHAAETLIGEFVDGFGLASAARRRVRTMVSSLHLVHGPPQREANRFFADVVIVLCPMLGLWSDLAALFGRPRGPVVAGQQPMRVHVLLQRDGIEAPLEAAAAGTATAATAGHASAEVLPADVCSGLHLLRRLALQHPAPQQAAQQPHP